MPKGLTFAHPEKGQLSAYDPSLRDNIAWLLSDLLGGGDRGKTNYINSRVRGAVDFAPGVGDAVGIDETKRAFDAGNYGEAAVNAATTGIGAIPIGGDLAAGALKSSALAAVLTPMSKRWNEMFHGTKVPFSGELKGDLADAGLHLTPVPKTADEYAGINDVDDPASAVGARQYPVLHNPNRVLSTEGVEGSGSYFPDVGEWTDPEYIEYEFRRNNPSGYSDPEMERIARSLRKGTQFSAALRDEGFDAFNYAHNPPGSWSPSSLFPATMVVDPPRVIGALSPRGIELRNLGLVDPSPHRRHAARLLDDDGLGYFTDWFRRN